MTEGTGKVESDPYVAIPVWVFERLRQEPALLALYAQIKHHYNWETKGAWPSQAHLAKVLGVTDRSIRKWLTRLVNLGAITVEHQFKNGQQTVSMYRMNWGVEPQFQAGRNTGSTLGRNEDSTLGRNESSYRTRTIEPEPMNQINGHALTLVAPDRFDEFWAAYPRKDAKADAKKAWAKAIKVENPDIIIAAAAALRADPNREAQFTPHGATWLNGERWNDGPIPAKTNGTRGERQISADQARQERLASLSLTQRRAIQ